MSEPTAKRIPYGSADFGRMRQDNSYYVDKTHFLPLLEAQPYFVFMIRPRRFGKTLWLSLLQHYYDINRTEQFDALFGGTYIGEHPTAERNSYLVMFLNFALVNPSVKKVEASFEDNGKVEVAGFVVQGFLLAYLNVSHFFLTWSEKEMGGGFIDFYLEPFLARYRDMKFGYLVELEYIPRKEFDQTRLEAEIREAEGQLARYAHDPRIQRVAEQVTLKKIVLVYSGWELVYCAEVD